MMMDCYNQALYMKSLLMHSNRPRNQQTRIIKAGRKDFPYLINIWNSKTELIRLLEPFQKVQDKNLRCISKVKYPVSFKTFSRCFIYLLAYRTKLKAFDFKCSQNENVLVVNVIVSVQIDRHSTFVFVSRNDKMLQFYVHWKMLSVVIIFQFYPSPLMKECIRF